MRLIGHIPEEAGAHRFGDYLYTRGIRSQVEAEGERWAVWVHEEEQLAAAREYLARFEADPSAPEFDQAIAEARKLRSQAQVQTKQAEKRFFDRQRVWPTGGAGRSVTLVLIGLCLLAGYLTGLGTNEKVLQELLITKIHTLGSMTTFSGGLPEVRQGQVWRLVTPIFVHFGWIHLIFNLLALWDLGVMIERKHGAWRFGLMVLVLAVVSNCGQYIFASSPRFGGISGVLYGLFGYIWMRGKHDPNCGLVLHPQIITLMLVWFFACLLQFIPHVANAAHGVGLVVGMAWGFISARLARR